MIPKIVKQRYSLKKSEPLLPVRYFMNATDLETIQLDYLLIHGEDSVQNSDYPLIQVKVSVENPDYLWNHVKNTLIQRPVVIDL